MGLTLLAHEPDKTLVVFASDSDLTAFRTRLAQYSRKGGAKYEEFGGIEHLLPVSPEDRVGARLKSRPLAHDDVAVPLDVELWHPGSADGAPSQRLDELGAAVRDLGGSLSDSIVTEDLLLARVHIDAQAIDGLLSIDRIREVDRIPDAGVPKTPTEAFSIDDFPEIEEPSEGSAGVLVLDAGITPNHPLLAPLVGEAAAFSAPGEPAYVALDTEGLAGGHGTAVCGRAGLGDVEALLSGATASGTRLFSARVLDDDCAYDPDRLVEHQLAEAIYYFLDNYPECKVINLSLADDRVVLTDESRQPRLAARIDELAYELRDRNVLFVVCTGNLLNPLMQPQPGDTCGLHLNHSGARLIEPASAALALTVGGIASGRNPTIQSRSAVAGTEGYPSPFTRRGPGLAGAVKPDVVEVAGDWVLDASSERVDDPSVGVLSTNRGFAPPEGRIVRRVNGTSFAAPTVANLAARLFDRFPDASPNLIRALIADSAQLPGHRPNGLTGKPWEEEVWRVFGHGRPEYERAAHSEENDVLLTTESVIALDSYQLFEVAEIPSEFIERSGQRLISVTLAYDPPTRQTRADSYFGVVLNCYLFRNTPVADVQQLFRDWKEAPAGPTEDELERKMDSLKGRQRVALTPGITLRKRSTLQKACCEVKNRSWQSEGPLVLAVTSQRRWAPVDVVDQRFAAIVSLKHSDPDVQLHARLQERQRARVRARARVQTG
ncbi:MAG TPA: S8 family peptidase [Solirubrobacterales bacterium]|jgi:subtilisin family serine protease|nr:S8 family peptidase [Solirubrobacterales bacterium]